MNDNGPPRDHANRDHEEPESARPRLEDSLKSKTTWLRVLFMIVMLILYGVSRIVLIAVMLVQLGYVLFTGTTHRPLLDFGKSLAVYTYQIVFYLTFNTDTRPFPFDADWPSAEPDNDAASDDASARDGADA